MNLQEIPQEWDFYFCRVEDKLASIRLNLALQRLAPIEKYPFRASFFVKMQQPDQNGMSSNEEYPVLCDIEDALQEKAEAMGCISVGVIKTNGALELCFYTQKEENLKKLDNELGNVLGKKFPKYLSKFDAEHDPDWGFYLDFLYPSVYDFQAMMNRRVVRQLQEQGDDLQNPREIDHWLYFASEKECNNFKKETENQGFKTLSQEKIDNDDFPFQLHISREDSPEEIDDVVFGLIDILGESEAFYDGWGCNVVN